MIIDLPATTTNDVTRRLIELRDEVGAMALSRVLTLIVVTDEAGDEKAIATAMQASRQHPCRIIVLVAANRRGRARLDAQVRLGGDAGASEVVVLRMYGPLTQHGRSVLTPLLLADSPIVAWWPGDAPKDPGHDPIGAIAQRRITDASEIPGTPKAVLGRLAKAYTPGDSDMSWGRITLWRALLAAALDQAPYESVTAATVVAAPDSPSGDLLAGWLAKRLRCPVSLTRSRLRTGVISVRLERASGTIDLVRPKDGETATLSQPGQPDRMIALPHRGDVECLADELRRLDPDEVYEDALLHGIPKVSLSRRTESEAVRAGLAPSEAASKSTARRLRAAARKMGSSAMVEALPTPPAASDEQTIKRASRRKLAAKATD